MTSTIDNIVEFTDFKPPNKRVLMLEVHYTTGKGYSGVVYLPKDGATKESIGAAVTAAGALAEDVIGTKIGK
jgi:hypothetical protein